MDISIIKPEDWSPTEVSEVISWQGHIPFAFSLMQILQPNCFVELGTHKGDSYFAFCDAVRHFNLSTSCFAVDTWVGDEHAGFYGDEIFEHVQSRNNQQYANFSKLIRSTFDGALQQFSEHSIDLLHIDGLHTYEAVRHDFETWREKLSGKGIVLFHDTVVREAGFGVWKFWEEISGQYPNFEFHHSNGLGVLAVGAQAVSIFPDLFDLQKEQVEQLRNTYATLGNSIAFTGAIKLLKKERASLEGLLNQERGIAGAEISNLTTCLAERDKQISGLIESLSEMKTQITIQGNVSEKLQVDRKKLLTQLQASKKQLREISQSTSWKITLPMREAKRWVSNPRRQLNKYANLGLPFFKRVYQALPINSKTKTAHIQALEKYFPKHQRPNKKKPNIIPLLTLPTLKQVMSKKFSNPMDYAKSIKLPVPQNPTVSFIIPTYGKVEYTLDCLASIAANIPTISFEVIVVDDCSPDDSYDVLKLVKGINLHRNAINQGFIRSCNTGAKIAQGEFLYFLNNDTEVTHGCLEALFYTFQDFPGTGYVGSKLIYPDGRLQEAGGVIWRDGSAWNVGRLQDPQLPEYNYAREVDYCSGASIMVPKALFDDLGGFDEHYLPAYGEDSDLALKIRDKNYRVIYQPQSTVIHYEGITSGTDTSEGVKAYQVDNAKKLYERWKLRLQKHQPPGKNVDNAKDRRATRRVLMIDHCTPTPDQDAGSVTVFNLMMLLREMDFQITFLPEDNFLYVPDYTPGLQSVGVEVVYTPYCSSVEQHIQEFGNRYDLAFIFRPDVARRHMKVIKKFCSKAKILYHTVDLHFLRMEREAQLQADQVKKDAAVEMKRRELAAIAAADASIVHSTAELDLLRPELPKAKLHVFPLIVDVRGAGKTFSRRRDIVFVGGYQHIPNVDAVQYFVKDIMPLLRARLPGVRFFAAGSRPPPELKALANEDVIITGFIEDLNPFLDTIRISVAPLRYGAGIKGKIGTAMAVGLPIVATPLAAEGMALTDNENILIADGAEAFAESIVNLYENESLWNRLSQNSLKFAESTWGAEAAWKILHNILADISIKPSRGNYPLSLFSESINASKKNIKRAQILLPLASVKNREGFNQALDSDAIKQISWIENILIGSTDIRAFHVAGYCIPCKKDVAFLVDLQSGGEDKGNTWIPNWRERLECPYCMMNNRQRLMATLIKQELDVDRKKHVYFMEQVTPIYNWAVEAFKNHDVLGSEYLGYEYEGGTIINGIRHEDVENLSFQDDSLDLIISNDVFEHVPNPAKALAECARVLKVGGVMLATVPFHSDKDESIARAKLVNGQLEHVLSPSYHGNPVSADEGSLVFTDFGWDVVKEFQAAGFSDVSVEIYASAELGHLGSGQLVFRAIKDKSSANSVLCDDVYQKAQQDLVV